MSFTQQQQPQQHPQSQEHCSKDNTVPLDPMEKFDLFEVEPENFGEELGPKVDKSLKKKPYDIMIIVMAVVIIVLILIIVWLLLSNKDEAVPENMVLPQYMRPPGSVPPQYMQQLSPQMQQQMQSHPMQPPPMQQQMQPPPPPMQSRTTKEDIDSVYEQLKQKSSKNEKLNVEQYTNNQEYKNSSNKLGVIEEVEEEDDEPNFD